jgi:hypothetical protein
MKLGPQVIEEMTEYDWRWDFSFSDIPAGIANNTAQVFPLGGANAQGSLAWNGVNNSQPQMKSGDQMVQAYLHIITPFANTADTGLNSTTMSFGDQGSATRFFSAVQGNLNGSFVTDSYYAPNNAYIYLTAALPQYLQFTLNSMAAKSISNLNQGKIAIYFQLYRAGAKEKNLDLSQPAYV